jgi:hypothetical protein
MDDLQVALAHLWAEHFNFLLSLGFYEEWEKQWFQEQVNFNKIYDC